MFTLKYPNSTVEDVYSLLVQFSAKIRIVETIAIDITDKLVSRPPEWENFLNAFDLGAYYHHRCQGYIECVKITGLSDVHTLNIWANQLVYPAAENFKYAITNVQKILQTYNMDQFETLNRELEDFKKIAKPIVEYANYFNVISPNLSL